MKIDPVTRRLAWWGIAALLLAAPPARAQEPAPQDAGQPASVYPTLMHDFGEVARGDKLSHAFVVRNEGTAPLEIQSVHPT